MKEVSREVEIENIENAMLELLLRALGAYEGALSDTAIAALGQWGSDRDLLKQARGAARYLKTKAMNLGANAQKYETYEWRLLGLE